MKTLRSLLKVARQYASDIMKRLVAGCGVLLVAGCASYEPAQRLDGFISLTGTDTNVRLKPGAPLLIFVPQQKGREITLARGEKTCVGDGHHFTTTVMFVERSEGGFRFIVDTVSRPPNERKERKVQHLLVPAYGDQQGTSSTTNSASVRDRSAVH